MSRIDPRELVKDDDSTILAQPCTKMPVDLAKIASQFSEFHQFVRSKTFEFQDKFEKTLVYLSSGAIVLTYGFLGQMTETRATAMLIIALCAWCVTCILSLVTIIVHIGQSVRAVNYTGAAVVSSEAYQFWDRNLRELRKVAKLADNNFIIFKDADGNDVKNGAEDFKAAIDKIAIELDTEKDKLKEYMDASYTSYTSEWWWNAILLLIFTIGCVAFAFFTYLRYWN